MEPGIFVRNRIRGELSNSINGWAHRDGPQIGLPKLDLDSFFADNAEIRRLREKAMFNQMLLQDPEAPVKARAAPSPYLERPKSATWDRRKRSTGGGAKSPAPVLSKSEPRLRRSKPEDPSAPKKPRPFLVASHIDRTKEAKEAAIRAEVEARKARLKDVENLVGTPALEAAEAVEQTLAEKKLEEAEQIRKRLLRRQRRLEKLENELLRKEKAAREAEKAAEKAAEEAEEATRLRRREYMKWRDAPARVVRERPKSAPGGRAVAADGKPSWHVGQAQAKPGEMRKLAGAPRPVSPSKKTKEESEEVMRRLKGPDPVPRAVDRAVLPEPCHRCREDVTGEDLVGAMQRIRGAPVLVTRRRRTRYVCKTDKHGVATVRIPTDDYILTAGMIPLRASNEDDDPVSSVSYCDVNL